MSTPRLPTFPEPFAYPTGIIPHACVCGSWPGGKCLRCTAVNFYTADQLHAYGLAVWKAAIEAAALTCEQERPHAPGEYCPWSDESEARYQAFTDAASAIRSLPDPSATPQEEQGR